MMTSGSQQKRYSLLLINPKQEYKHYSLQIGMARLLNKCNAISTLSLPLLAALTPDHYDIRIIDEEVEQIPRSIAADIVGITTMANTCTRAYAIADRFMQRSIPVVLGGPHVSYAIEEGLHHAVTIVDGEAEPVWLQLLEDFEKGNLQKVYRSDSPVPFTRSPVPRWDLMKTDKYLSFPVQATRGCPYNCEFCLVTKMFGRKVRFREIDDIIEEITALPEKRAFFVDDNLTINKRFARDLVTALHRLGITWTCQASIELADDEELLRAMANAGCEYILIGFESLNIDNLKIIRKYHNTRADYVRAVQKIHSAGIHVLASFIVGLDHDTETVFDEIHIFTLQNAMAYVTLNMLGCEPGTDLYTRMEKENRLCKSLPNELRGGMFPTLYYKNMGLVEATNAFYNAIDRIYSFESIFIKAQKLFSSDSFHRPKNDTGFSVIQKAIISLKLLRAYLVTTNSAKRRLLFLLFGVYREGKVAMERIVTFLLSMEGFSRYIAFLQKGRQQQLALCKELEEARER